MEQYNFISVFLLICQIISVSLSDAVIEENNQHSEAATLKETYSEHPKLPIFPRNTFKFVVTSKPYIKTIYNDTNTKIMTRMPIMPHIALKPKDEIISTTQLTSRKPLMKLRTFTMKSRANGKYNWLEKNTRVDLKDVATPTSIGELKTELETQIHKDPITKSNLNKPSRSNGEKILLLRNDGKLNNDQIGDVKDPITELYLPEESRRNTRDIPLLHNYGKGKMDQSSEEPTSTKIKADNFSSEEDEDRNEFIFLENDNETQEISDTLYNTAQDFEYSFETTTDLNLKRKIRVKRSSNIIEEENFASTISGLKYTRRETRLNNDLYFKNINS